jgi:beta-galactosidase
VKRITLLVIAALTAVLRGWSAEPVRERRNFDDGWRFQLGEARGGEQPGLDDNGWRKVNLPHDWSIEGPHNSANASGTGYLPGGIGWYRKSFRLAEALSSRKIFIGFDGVYRDSDVWINGSKLGHRPSGYASFEYDLTPYVNFGARANLVAVRVDHSAAADSRFYTGSGIYRHVWLTVTEAVHVVRWGTYVHTPLVREAEALVTAETSVANESKAAAPIRLVTAIEDAGGREVASVATEAALASGAVHTFAQQGAVAKPRLWSIEDPYLYTAVTRVFAGGTQVDEYRTPFGIRTIRFDWGRWARPFPKRRWNGG